MERQNKVELGTVSEGTMRDEDLLEAFTDALHAIAPSHHDRWCADAREVMDVEDWDDADDDLREQLHYAVEDLFTVLEEYAPPFAYFGSHPGDGACYGFWPDLESLTDAASFGEVLKVDDTSDVPVDYSGEVMHVSDHGNVTLYACTNGELSEIWAAV